MNLKEQLDITLENMLNEKIPTYGKKVIKALKKNKEVKNPYAVFNSMKNKGDKFKNESIDYVNEDDASSVYEHSSDIQVAKELVKECANKIYPYLHRGINSPSTWYRTIKTLGQLLVLELKRLDDLEA